jgi:hypothetical protein
VREAREDGATLRIVNMAGLLMTSITRQQSIGPIRWNKTFRLMNDSHLSCVYMTEDRQNGSSQLGDSGWMGYPSVLCVILRWVYSIYAGSE